MTFKNETLRRTSLVVVVSFLVTIIPSQILRAETKPKSWPTVLIPIAEDDKPNSLLMRRLWEILEQRPGFKFLDLNSVLDRGSQRTHFSNLSKAKEHFDKGSQSYKEANYPGALVEFERSVQLYEQSFSFLEKQKEKDFYDTLVFQGIANGMSGAHKEAVNAFKYAIIFQPQAKFDFSKFPPIVGKLFKQAQDSLKTSGRGTLMVGTVPPNAQVFVNGHYRGVSPVRVKDLPEGRNFLKIEKVGYSKWNGVIKIRGGRSTEKFVTLAKARRQILLRNMLPGIKQELNQKKTGEAILGLQSLFYNRLAIFARIEGMGLERTADLYLFDLEEKKRLAHVRENINWKRYAKATAEASVDRFLKDFKPDELDPQVKEVEPSTIKVVKAKPIYKQWWFWTVIGVVVAGGVTTAAVLATRKPDELEGIDKVDGTGGIVIRF